MACNISAGIALDCIDSIGGIKKAWIGTNVVITSIASVSGTPGLLTDVTGTGTVYEFELPKDTSSFVENFNIAPTAGTAFWSQELTLVFHRLEASKRDQLLLLARNRDMKVIFQDSNDKYWLMGKDRGAQISAGSGNTGTAVADANQYSITLTAQEPDMAYELNGTPADVLNGITVTNA